MSINVFTESGGYCKRPSFLIWWYFKAILVVRPSGGLASQPQSAAAYSAVCSCTSRPPNSSSTLWKVLQQILKCPMCISYQSVFFFSWHSLTVVTYLDFTIQLPDKKGSVSCILHLILFCRVPRGIPIV